MNFIRTSLDVVQQIIQKDTADRLQEMDTPRVPFAEVARAFTGMMKNPPAAWVMPRMTDLPDNDGNLIPEQDLVTVKLGVAGSDAESVEDAALDYVRAVDEALRAAAVAELDPTILHLRVRQHDYGPLWQKEGGFARFPELHLVIDRLEVES
jgi:hypothetical protein